LTPSRKLGSLVAFVIIAILSVERKLAWRIDLDQSYC